MRGLPEAEKLEFVKTSVAWIQGQDTMDRCFVLNFGYVGPLPWPQVGIGFYLESLNLSHLKVFMTLDDEVLGTGLDIVTESYGMAVPSACTIVIVAGEKRPC